MSNYHFPPHVDELLRKQLARGEYTSEDDVLLAALESLDADNEDWSAVKEALDTLDAGEQGVSLEEAIAEVRRRNNVLPAK